MDQSTQISIVKDQTNRALWEVRNVISCIPEEIWDKCYCESPLWQHVYHMLHSLDLWFINPHDAGFQEPAFHTEELNNLDMPPAKRLERAELLGYFTETAEKIRQYLCGLTDADLLKYPPNCPYTRFTLILAQHRHLHSHMGMIMGFLIADTGKWPRVLGLEGTIPQGLYDPFF